MRSLRLWLLVGILIRLFFMIFAAHGDFFMINKALHYFSVHGVIDIYKYIRLHPKPIGWGDYFTYPPLSYFVLGTFQFILRPLMPFLDRIAESPNAMKDPNLLRYLFTMKLPYLFFDMAGAFLWLRFFDSTEERLRAYKFWLISPVVIFGTYLIGQFDVIPTFFIILAFYYVYKKEPVKSLFVLGVSAAFKNFALLLMPVFVIIQGRSLKDYAKLSLFGLLPYLLTTIPFMFSPYYRQATMFAATTRRLVELQVPLGYGQTLYIFFIGYVFILAFAFYYKREGSFTEVLNVSLAMFILFYAFTVFHPQWFIWIMPLLAIQFALDRQVWPFHLILVVGFVFITFYWGKGLAGGLLAPLSPDFFWALPSPAEIIGRFTSATGVLNLFRTIFSGTAVWIAFLSLRNMPAFSKGKELKPK